MSDIQNEGTWISGYKDGKDIVRAPLDADNSDIAKFIREEETGSGHHLVNFKKKLIKMCNKKQRDLVIKLY